MTPLVPAGEFTGLVIRTTDVREADRLVTIYTKEAGVITATAVGARSFKSRKMAATSLFCYAKFQLAKRGEYYQITEVSLIESFFGLRDTLEGMALASYLVDVLGDVSIAEPDENLLRLTLNSLFAIASKKAPLWQIKASFEIRLCSEIGFRPEVLACRECGEKLGNFIFDIMDGNIVCYACRQKAIEAKIPDYNADLGETFVISLLSEGAKIALGYCIYSPLEKLFSFHIASEDADLFCGAAESYLLNHLERGYKTLDFYHSMERR